MAGPKIIQDKPKSPAPAGRSLYQIQNSLRENMSKKSINATPKEGKKLKAKSLRLANRNYTVGDTTFSFDKDGICKVIDTGRALYDYNILITLSGIEALPDDDIPPVPTITEPIPEVITNLVEISNNQAYDYQVIESKEEFATIEPPEEAEDSEYNIPMPEGVTMDADGVVIPQLTNDIKRKGGRPKKKP